MKKAEVKIDGARHPVRYLLDNGKPWFLGFDIFNLLGYSTNSSVAGSFKYMVGEHSKTIEVEDNNRFRRRPLIDIEGVRIIVANARNGRSYKAKALAALEVQLFNRFEWKAEAPIAPADDEFALKLEGNDDVAAILAAVTAFTNEITAAMERLDNAIKRFER